jgi:hypothetical protein
MVVNDAVIEAGKALIQELDKQRRQWPEDDYRQFSESGRGG